MIGKQRISFTQSSSPPEWGAAHIDIVVDCTGQRTSRKTATEHLAQGAKMVLVSAPVDEPDRTVIFGYNHQSLTGEDRIISAASCTTNCLIHMLLAVQQIARVEFGLMSTVHSYTADQRLVDSPHNDRRRGRAAAVNIVPTTTGAARATGSVIAELKGRIDGCSFRVPVPDVSLVDLTLQMSESVDVDEINHHFIKVAEGSLFFKVISGPIVSSDILGSSASCSIDLGMTMSVGTLLKIVGWYDNEWGYANRLVDILCYLSSTEVK